MLPIPCAQACPTNTATRRSPPISIMKRWTVFRQIIDFQRKAGPFGNLNIIGRSGFLTHAEAVKGIKMFAREVLPRLDEGKLRSIRSRDRPEIGWFADRLPGFKKIGAAGRGPNPEE